ncbi:hypothetical protein B0H17DRAFT_1140336 [Mycena rosella]|uniref:Uncharacterized protein n=1 Tax=Mycena rosella TaxID=1033263 RepID=A0AAD7GBD1_MYCRO|nr:hypothetical protein B0H17DRAFT_1140336 [Mycena rosella]
MGQITAQAKLNRERATEPLAQFLLRIAWRETSCNWLPEGSTQSTVGPSSKIGRNAIDQHTWGGNDHGEANGTGITHPQYGIEILKVLLEEHARYCSYVLYNFAVFAPQVLLEGDKQRIKVGERGKGHDDTCLEWEDLRLVDEGYFEQRRIDDGQINMHVLKRFQ